MKKRKSPGRWTVERDGDEPFDDWEERVLAVRRDACTRLGGSLERQAEALGCEVTTLRHFLTTASKDTVRTYCLARQSGVSANALLGTPEPTGASNEPRVLQDLFDAIESDITSRDVAVGSLPMPSLPDNLVSALRMCATAVNDREVMRRAFRYLAVLREMDAIIGDIVSSCRTDASTHAFRVALENHRDYIRELQTKLIGRATNDEEIVAEKQSVLATFDSTGPLLTHREIPASTKDGSVWRYQTDYDVQSPSLGFAWRGPVRRGTGLGRGRGHRKGRHSGTDFVIHLDGELRLHVMDWNNGLLVDSLEPPPALIRVEDFRYLLARADSAADATRP